MQVQIEASWQQALEAEFSKPYFVALTQYIKQTIQAGKIVYPKGTDIFKAFELCPLANVKVVILGQDPYHGPGQAHGLSFSVQAGVAPPPSLVNIYKELVADINCPMPAHGNLIGWAQQGVLLLNSALTVEQGAPMSHANIGWHTFTDAVINKVSEHSNNVVFILWGKFAQSKLPLINTSKHLVLQSAHPSPLSAHNGFWGTKPFSKTNTYLQAHKLQAINWQI
jgi:uracil-DNA glycosylase